MAQPIGFEATFDDNGNLVVSAEAISRLRIQLGHEPEPGERVNLTLVEPEGALEGWLRTEVVASYDELRADPGSGLSAEQVRARLAQRHAARTAEG